MVVVDAGPCDCCPGGSSGSSGSSGGGTPGVSTVCCNTVLIPATLYLTLQSPNAPSGCGPGGCMNSTVTLTYNGTNWVGTLDCTSQLGGVITFTFGCNSAAGPLHGTFKLAAQYIVTGTCPNTTVVAGDWFNLTPNSCSPFSVGSLSSGAQSVRNCTNTFTCTVFALVTS